MSGEHPVPDDQLPRPTLRFSTDDGVTRVAGEVDETTADDFAAALGACNGASVRTLDLSDVTFFSAAGVRSLVANGWTTDTHPFVIASAVVRRVLSACDLDFLLTPDGQSGEPDCSSSMV